MNGQRDNTGQRRADRRMIAAIVVLVVLWAAAMIGRNDIRARWWAFRLERADTVQGRTEYFQRLTGLAETGLPAARSLLRSDDAGVRGFAVALLNHIDDAAAGRLLIESLGDPDANVRRTAILGLSRRRPTAEVISRLGGLIDANDPDTACAAIVGLASIETPDAVAAAIGALDPRHPAAIRVQAIESLAEIRAGAAVDALKTCLNDDTVFEGLTENERQAKAAVERWGGLPADEVSFEHPKTVGQWAARALYLITGQRFDADAPDSEPTQP